MHLQIKSVVVAGSAARGRNADEGAEGITIARPGRLLRLLDILAEDRRGRGRPRRVQLVGGGSRDRDGGEFSFSVETTERTTTRTTRPRSTDPPEFRRAGSSR